MFDRVLCWFSCGAASAVAAKKAIEKYGARYCEVLYCDTLKYEHPDNKRFMKDVEHWLDKEIKILKNPKYSDIFDVFNKTGYLSGVKGARCSTELKKNVRKAYQRIDDTHVFGLTANELDRINQFEHQNFELIFDWILRDLQVTKRDCFKIIQDAHIELPTMYKLGYKNNNCLGCCKGQAGYWNKIRKDFPDVFDRMAKQERKMGIAICKTEANDTRTKIFLDELDPNQGLYNELEDIECGPFCISETDEFD